MKRCFSAILIFLLLSGCGGTAKKTEATVFAMDTVMTLTAYGKGAEAAIAEAKAEIARLDALLSATDGAVADLNSAEGAEACGKELCSLIGAAAELSMLTGGAFDITVQPLMALWGFGTDRAALPSEADIAAALERVGYEKLKIAGEGIDLGGAEITLGGIAKGYASDMLTALFDKAGVPAIVSLGGNVQAAGTKPGGSQWLVAVRDPKDASAVVGSLAIKSGAVVTSGGYERYFVENGETYHHILDPATGYPAESGLLSVTVVCESGMRADALSTAFFVMGLEKSLEFCRENPEIEAIFVTSGGKVVCTKGLEGAFTPSGTAYSFEFR